MGRTWTCHVIDVLLRRAYDSSSLHHYRMCWKMPARSSLRRTMLQIWMMQLHRRPQQRRSWPRHHGARSHEVTDLKSHSYQMTLDLYSSVQTVQVGASDSTMPSQKPGVVHSLVLGRHSADNATNLFHLFRPRRHVRLQASGVEVGVVSWYERFVLVLSLIHI